MQVFSRKVVQRSVVASLQDGPEHLYALSMNPSCHKITHCMADALMVIRLTKSPVELLKNRVSQEDNQ